MTDDPEATLRKALVIACATSLRGLRDARRYAPMWLAGATVLFIAQAAIPALEVILLKRLVGALSVGTTSPADLALPLAGLTIVVGLNFPLGQVALAVSQRMGLRLNWHYQSDLAHAAARLRPSQLADPDVTNDLQGAQRGIEYIGRVAGNALQLVGTLITSVALSVTVSTINVLSGFLVIGSLIPTVAAFTFIGRAESRGWPLIAAQERRATYATEQLLQQRSGTELAVLGSGAKVAELVSEHRREAMNVLDRLIGVAMRWELASGAGTALLLAGALTAMTLQGASGAGAAAAVAGIISGLQAIRFSGYAFGNVMSAAPHARIYQRLFSRVPSDTAQPPVNAVATIRAHDVTLTYPGASEPALRDVTIQAKHGEIIALVGVNGAGKTTAINALIGILTCEAGTITIDRMNADALAEPERLARFGLLTQEFGRYEFTVRDVVALGTPTQDITDAAIWAALESARAAAFVRRLPEGLDTQLGQQWGGTGLSGGQWQRLALARIYLRNAGIWILDEPTSAIDAEAEQEIFAELQRTRADRITIVVSHRAWTLKDMDRIYVFDDGRITQDGTYEQLLAQPGRFAAIFAEQTS